MRSINTASPLIQLYTLRLPGLWLAGGGLLIGVIVYLSLATSGPVVEVSFNDKIGHFVAYTSLMLWFGGIFRRRTQWLLVFLFFGLGVGLEFLQGLGGTRTLSTFDMGMNGLGVITGKKLCRMGLGGWCRKVEQVLFS